MPYSSMTRDQWLAFLRSPIRPALLATTRADGRPHVVPVWYDLDGDDTIVFTTGAETVKGRNIARDGRVALCVQNDQPPFDFVTVEGRATTSDDADDLLRWSTDLGGRYMGRERADEFGRRNAVPGELIVRVAIDRVVAVADISE
jgi:PPOX class probable F420-dependent enzyme